MTTAGSTRGASVRLDGLCKVFGAAPAVSDLSLDVAAGEFLTLLGPSGSGKSTTLLMIAGFLVPTRGEVFIGGIPVTGKPPHERDIGVVFQNYALFPHLSVFENVAFPLKMRRQPAARIAERVAWALDLVRLEGLGHRRPHQLSGGQQQRVALARALVFEPSLLLMDEPLGALDRRLRETMQVELKRLQRTLALTVICVTHDQEEALTLSDRIAVMNHGRIEQVGAPEEVYERPHTPFVAGFLGECNALTGTVLRIDGARTVVRTAGGLEITAARGEAHLSGAAVQLAIRPERIAVLGTRDADDNVMEAVVEEVVYLGDAQRCLVRPAQGEPLTLKTNRAGGTPREGQVLRLGWPAEAVMVYPARRSAAEAKLHALPPRPQAGEGQGGG